MLSEELNRAYRILGISSRSSADEITRAYRRLAKKYHPDFNPQDPERSHTMMMELNEAYRVVRDHLRNGRPLHDFSRRSTYQQSRKKTPASGRTWPPGWEEYAYTPPRRPGWYERFQEEKRRQEEVLQRKREKAVREQQALNEFWRRLAAEKKYEMDDRRSYDVIIKYTYRLISLFYELNIQNHYLRARPYGKQLFDDFMDRYNLLLEKSSKITGTSKSERYRQQVKRVHRFLKAFIDDSLSIYPIASERRASALQAYEKSIKGLERFMGYYFSHPDVPREDAMQMFDNVLGGFEYFLKDFPESSLVAYTYSKIDVLEKWYRAFMKEHPYIW
ncbi:MAG: J domain-containing protein [Spirochaetota bacterium]